ncbi:hypothetical protein MtrunA17_Chr2g0307601 [Medicago truncatula]|uniref:Transmembrane protein n=1 Tax=Medicago truncatula TaxID=3880 RepID=A0A396J7K7_MEDTR|nr:hypothetical protein MtrunA17_Chr2g0307601 [Medicago truncatula]
MAVQGEVKILEHQIKVSNLLKFVLRVSFIFTWLCIFHWLFINCIY